MHWTRTKGGCINLRGKLPEQYTRKSWEGTEQKSRGHPWSNLVGKRPKKEEEDSILLAQKMGLIEWLDLYKEPLLMHLLWTLQNRRFWLCCLSFSKLLSPSFPNTNNHRKFSIYFSHFVSSGIKFILRNSTMWLKQEKENRDGIRSRMQ